MSAAATTFPAVSAEQYLRDPEFRKLEWVDGALVGTAMGGKRHSILQLALGQAFREYLAGRPGFYAATELRCRLEYRKTIRFRLPDVCVVAGDPDDGDPRYLEGAPLLAVELHSPDMTVASMLRKLDEYLANGCRLAWLILPEERSVLVATPDGRVRTVLPGESLDGGDALPGLSIELDELFG
jgi:Uma2 family endonuclease